MSRQKTHHAKEFKLDAINYRKEHPDLTQVECAKNLCIGVSTLVRWEAPFRNNDGDIPVIGSGSYASDEAKKIARIKRELRDTTDITYIWTQDGFVYYGLVCQKNHCLDSCRHYGSIYSYRNNQQGKKLS